MAERQLIPWARQTQIVPAEAKTPAEIVSHALQLSRRDVGQIVSAFENCHFEMASTYVWSKSMAGLQQLLATLGMEFIGEMLQRPDITGGSDIAAVVTPSETISLAEDLGIVSATEAMRLRQAHEVITHFASVDPEMHDEEGMNPEEAIGCLRSCVQSVLGRPKLEVARDFAKFRKLLEEATLDEKGKEVEALLDSPYFYRKTTLSVLLALLKTAEGAPLEHVVRNINLVLPMMWKDLRKPERWQAGQTYAELYAQGKKAAVTGLKHALIRVSGFDYVPENLRSNTFSAAAKGVLEAHEGMNNFYNEPAPMQILASLGSTIPSPAFPICVTATLSVWLGNCYGHSWAAQESARQVLRGLSRERWTYYLDECLPNDRRILFKLASTKPCERWVQLVHDFVLRPEVVTNTLVRNLLKAGDESEVKIVAKTAAALQAASVGQAR